MNIIHSVSNSNDDFSDPDDFSSLNSPPSPEVGELAQSSDVDLSPSETHEILYTHPKVQKFVKDNPTFNTPEFFKEFFKLEQQVKEFYTDHSQKLGLFPLDPKRDPKTAAVAAKLDLVFKKTKDKLEVPAGFENFEGIEVYDKNGLKSHVVKKGDLEVVTRSVEETNKLSKKLLSDPKVMHFFKQIELGIILFQIQIDSKKKEESERKLAGEQRKNYEKRVTSNSEVKTVKTPIVAVKLDPKNHKKTLELLKLNTQTMIAHANKKRKNLKELKKVNNKISNAENSRVTKDYVRQEQDKKIQGIALYSLSITSRIQTSS
ncbi:MAG: hypothetical protein H0W88_12475 [Parachlamydiaceae bacterium]|nr:hypothetical protein [Parachlamydiaceae bacterium]